MDLYTLIMSIFGKKFYGSPSNQEIQTSRSPAVDEFVELFGQTWSVLSDLVGKYGMYFSQQDIDKLKVLEIQLGLLRQSVINNE